MVQDLAAALHLAGDYAESDKTCERFRTSYPKSPLLPAVLFRSRRERLLQPPWPPTSCPTRRIASARRPSGWTRRSSAIRSIVEKYPESPHVNLARYGLGMAYYRKGDLDKAKETLEAIPAADRNGDLALVPYQLADILIRQAPAKADDALAAGKLEEQLEGGHRIAGRLRGGQPNSPQAPDALLKLGHCQQTLAGMLAQPPDQAKALAAARAAYEQCFRSSQSIRIRRRPRSSGPSASRRRRTSTAPSTSCGRFTTTIR